MAKITILGKTYDVHATTEHSQSSYNIPVWVDGDGQAIAQVCGTPALPIEADCEAEASINALRKAVKMRRVELGLTIEWLAKASGVPYPTISQFEGGKKGISLDNLCKLASAMGRRVMLG